MIRHCTSIYKWQWTLLHLQMAVDSNLEHTKFSPFPRPTQKKTPPYAWFDFKTRIISVSETSTQLLDSNSKDQLTTSADNATTTTTSSTKLSTMSQTMSQDIFKLQHDIQKLSFCTKITEAEMGLTQSNLF